MLDNYWGDYGGISYRLNWVGGSTSPSQGNFFTNEAAIQSYLNYVNYTINRVNHYTGVRYRDDPYIFAWEVMNEPRYQGFGDDGTSNVLRGWMDRVGQFIKARDPNHLVSSGIEGHGLKYGFGGDEGNNFTKIHASPYIDFCSAHPYPTEGWANLNIAQTQALLAAWTYDCQQVLGKPMFLGEFNVDTSHGSRPDWWKAIYSTVESLNIGGTAFWWFESNHVDSTYGLTTSTGAAELAVFKNHSLVMQAKHLALNYSVTTTTTTTRTTTAAGTTVSGGTTGECGISFWPLFCVFACVYVCCLFFHNIHPF